MSAQRWCSNCSHPDERWPTNHGSHVIAINHNNKTPPHQHQHSTTPTPTLHHINTPERKLSTTPHQHSHTFNAKRRSCYLNWLGL